MRETVKQTDGKDKSVPSQDIIRKLKNPRRRRRGQRRLKNEIIFYLRISRYPKVIYFVYLCQS